MRTKSAAIAIVLLAAAPAAAQPAAPPGAAACSGCHPRTGGAAATAVQSLAGRAPGEIVDAMQAFRKGERSATVMDRIAKGFSDEETRSIAAWVSAQK